jgi:2-dehydro-3-deoxygalactonokinase
MTSPLSSAAWPVPVKGGLKPDISRRRRDSSRSWSRLSRFPDDRVTSESYRGSPSVTAKLLVMRGEETQLLGALGVDAAAEAVVCMPGTHSKWARVSGGTVERFATFMTGELFSVVSRETILSHAVASADDAEDIEPFKSAVLAAFEAPAFAANLLFQVRSNQLLFGGRPSSARERISGTLIGIELAAGLVGNVSRTGITLVASGRLKRLYQLAFETLSVSVQSIDAEDAVRRGLSMAAAAIWKM